MITQTEPAPYVQADYDAEQAATKHAAAGEWEQHAQPGFEAKVGEIAVDAAHDLADLEDADREWDKIIAMDDLHEEAHVENEDREIEKEHEMNRLHEEAHDMNDMHDYDSEKKMDDLHQKALVENDDRTADATEAADWLDKDEALRHAYGEVEADEQAAADYRRDQHNESV